jgi:hypothetical protein
VAIALHAATKPSAPISSSYCYYLESFVKLYLQIVKILLHWFTSLQQTRSTTSERAMYTTINEEGLLNNYANEPDLYYAVYPSPSQQRSYALRGAIATLFVTALVLVSLAVS